MKTNENTMWPEKIAAIYAQFPWLQKVHPQASVDRAYVKRFDESVLDICTDSEMLEEGDLFVTSYVRTLRTSVYLVDQTGASTAVGQKIVNRRTLFFFKCQCVDYTNETVRHAIQNLPKASTATHVVLVQHGNCYVNGDGGMTRLTVFKPNQNGVTLRQWYADQIASVNKAVAEEVEST